MKYFHEVKEEAKRHGISTLEVMNVFLESYEKHKEAHGSFRHLTFVHGEHYIHKMHERYQFMRDEAMKYIETRAAVQKLRQQK